MAWLENTLRFGKAVELQAEKNGTGYVGTMNDYVASRLKPVTHAPCTIKAASTTFLTPDEESQLRGTIASINWVSREGRPDGAAAASILSGCFPNPTVKDAMDTNRVAAKLKGQHITLKVHNIPEEQIRHIVISDAAFDQTGRVKPQHGWIQGVTTPAMNAGKLAPITLIGWKSRRLRRKAGSTMLCESVSLSTALGALEKQVSTWRSICFSRFDARQQAEEDDAGGLQGAATVLASEDPLFSDPLSLAVVDAKSIFDASTTEQSQGSDDRTALETAIIRDSLSRLKGRVRWIPHNCNPSDSLTKLFQAHEKPMMDLLRTNHFQIQAEDAVLAEGNQRWHRMKTIRSSQ